MAPPLVRASVVSSWLPRLVAQAGGTVERFIRQAEVPVYLLDDPEAPMLLEDALRIYEFAARWIGDEHFYLREGLSVDVQDLGEFGEFVMSHQRFQDIIAVSHSFLESLQQATRMWAELRQQDLIWNYRIERRFQVGRRHDSEFAVGNMLNAFRQRYGSGLLPRAVLMEEPGNRQHARDLDDLFGVPVLFDQPASGLVLDREMIEDAPTIHSKFAGTHVNRGAMPSPLPTVNAQVVREMLVSAIRYGEVAISEISRVLKISPRTLQRYLRDDSTSYSQILLDVRLEFALAQLDQPRTRITDVAHSLGYSDSAHFTRAFKQWTGTTPTEYRSSTIRTA